MMKIRFLCAPLALLAIPAYARADPDDEVRRFMNYNYGRYDECAKAAAAEFASQPEDAATVGRAVFGYCREKWDWYAATAGFTGKDLEAAEEAEREHATGLVMHARAAAKGH